MFHCGHHVSTRSKDDWGFVDCDGCTGNGLEAHIRGVALQCLDDSILLWRDGGHGGHSGGTGPTTGSKGEMRDGMMKCRIDEGVGEGQSGQGVAGRHGMTKCPSRDWLSACAIRRVPPRPWAARQAGAGRRGHRGAGTNGKPGTDWPAVASWGPSVGCQTNGSFLLPLGTSNR